MFLIVYNGRLLRSATRMHWITLAHGRFLKASFQAYNSPRLCHPRKQRWTFQLPSLCGIYGRPLGPFTHLAIHWVTWPGSLEAKAQLQPFSAESRQSCFTLCEATFYCNELCFKKKQASLRTCPSHGSLPQNKNGSSKQRFMISKSMGASRKQSLKHA